MSGDGSRNYHLRHRSDSARHSRRSADEQNAGVQWLLSAGAQTMCVSVREGKAMNCDDNDKLLEFGRKWKLDGDWMVCKKCKRPIIASRDGEELPHADGCKQPNEQHPWRQLREIIAPAAPQWVRISPETMPEADSDVFIWNGYAAQAGYFTGRYFATCESGEEIHIHNATHYMIVEPPQE